jgi:hypothetical protein
MFNRQPYNRGKFNISSVTATGGEGIGNLSLEAPPVLANRTISAPLSTADMSIGMFADGTITKFANADSTLEILSSGNGTIVKFNDGFADLEIGAEANAIVAGESLIRLLNINLKPNDELIINTCDMTVTINGQNGMRFFSVDSDFFSLLQGANTIIYSDNASSRNIYLDLIWKDRWI